MSYERIYERGAMPIHIGGGVVCAALLLCGWVFGLGPLLSVSHQATAVIQRADESEREAKKRKAELDQVTHELALVRERLDQQPVNLEPASQINPVLGQLAGWADDHGLSITRTQAGRAKALSYYDYVPITIAGEGGYVQMLGFFHRLHADRGDLGVVAFSTRRLTSGKGVSFEIELAWYVRNDDSASKPDQATAAVETR